MSWLIVRRSGFETHSGDLARRWEGSGKARGDLRRQWQSAKGPRKGFVSWWTVLRSGFESLYKMARRWESSGKALKAHGRVSWWTVLRSSF